MMMMVDDWWREGLFYDHMMAVSRVLALRHPFNIYIRARWAALSLSLFFSGKKKCVRPENDKRDLLSMLIKAPLPGWKEENFARAALTAGSSKKSGGISSVYDVESRRQQKGKKRKINQRLERARARAHVRTTRVQLRADRAAGLFCVPSRERETRVHIERENKKRGGQKSSCFPESPKGIGGDVILQLHKERAFFYYFLLFRLQLNSFIALETIGEREIHICTPQSGRK